MNKQDGVLGRGLFDVAPAAKLLEISSLLRSSNPAPKPSSLFSSIHPEAICIASGKGGTGKTFFAANLAVVLAQQGKRVLLFDADLGLGNTHLHLGLNPSLHVGHFLRGEKKIEEVVQEGLPGILFLPGGSGVSELSSLTLEQWSRLVLALKELSRGVDTVLIDLPAGIGSQVFRFLKIASRVIIVTTPEIPSMIDAYALVKIIRQQQIPIELNMIINRAHEEKEVGRLFQKMSQMIGFHLKGTRVAWLGFIPEDRMVTISIREQCPIVSHYPNSIATQFIKKIPHRLRDSEGRKEETCLPSPSPIKREDPEKQRPLST